MTSAVARVHNIARAADGAPAVKSRIPFARASNANRGSRQINLSSRVQQRVAHQSQQPQQPQVKPVVDRPKQPFKFIPMTVGDEEDPSEVIEYQNAIYRTLRQNELTAKTLQFNQSDISLTDRNLIVDAIDRFHYKLALTTNSFYRFIGIFDRYLSVKNVGKNELLVTACASLFIASKIEDIYCANSEDIKTLAGGQFTQEELFKKEVEVINAIGFDTTFGTGLFYLTHFMRMVTETQESLLLARYILEICQSHSKFFGMVPSKAASVAVVVTRILQHDADRWPSILASFTQYSLDDLMEAAVWVHEILLEKDRPETRFMRRKYCSDIFYCVGCVDVPASF